MHKLKLPFIGMLVFFVIANFACIASRSKSSDSTQNNSQTKDSTKSVIYSGPAKIKFDSTTYHKGSIKKGEVLKFEIPFSNAGAEALEIKLISACECTTVDWPVLPIPSGEKRTLKISYDSKDKSGKQIVDLDIMANTENQHTFVKFELTVLE